MQSTVLLMYQDPISASRLVVWRCCFNFPTYCHHLKAEEDQETKCVLTCWIELPHTNAAQPRRRNMKMLISTCDPCQWSEIRDQMTVAIETGQKPVLCLHTHCSVLFHTPHSLFCASTTRHSVNGTKLSFKFWKLLTKVWNTLFRAPFSCILL